MPTVPVECVEVRYNIHLKKSACINIAARFQDVACRKKQHAEYCKDPDNDDEVGLYVPI